MAQRCSTAEFRLNDLAEGFGHRNIKWIIAGAGDAASPAVQSLLKQREFDAQKAIGTPSVSTETSMCGFLGCRV